MASVRKTERLLNLIAFFLNVKDPKSLDEIAKIEGYRGKSAEALRQCFYRDRRELARMGVMITYDAEREGYFLPSDKRYLPALRFSPDEIAALRLLQKLVEEKADFPWKTELKMGLQKILLEAEPEEDSNVNLPFVFDLKIYNSREEELVKIIEQAITQRKEVSFSYRSPRKGKAEKWVVQPYLLFNKEKMWYLVAYSPQHSDYRTFRLSRIQGKVKVLNEESEEPDFERQPDFRQEDFFFMFPWEYGTSTPVEVRVRFSPKAAFWVEKSSCQKLTEERDGSEVLLFKVKDEDSFINWMLSFAEDAEILTPPSMRQKLKEALNQIEKVYQNGSA